MVYLIHGGIMWTLKENSNRTWSAQNYTTKLHNDKMVRIINSEVTGTEREVFQYMLSFDYITNQELFLAMKNMMETGSDTAYFGMLGSFIFSRNESTLGLS